MKKGLIGAVVLAVFLSGCSQVIQQYDKNNEADRIINESTVKEVYSQNTIAENVVQAWSEGIKGRDGKLQFSLMSKELQDVLKPKYEEINWVTGVSSPWVDKYEIKIISETDKEAIYEISFYMATSTGKSGVESAKLYLRKLEGSWVIAKVESDVEYLPQ